MSLPPDHPLGALRASVVEPLTSSGVVVPRLRTGFNVAEERGRSSHGRKTEILFRSEHRFAEEVVVTVLRDAGWQAFWTDGWKRRFWPEDDWPDSRLKDLLDAAQACRASRAGVWDVLATDG